MPGPDKINVGLRPLTKTRLERMKAQAVILGWGRIKSIDDAVDLLLQAWDKAFTKEIILTLVKPPAHLR